MSEPLAAGKPAGSAAQAEPASVLAADEAFMRLALEAAARARAVGEVPVGAVVVKDAR